MLRAPRLLSFALFAAGSAGAVHAQCNGFSLIPLANGPDNEVFATAFYDTNDSAPGGEVLIVGGSFASVGGVPARRVAMFDPVTGVWSAMGPGAGGGGLSGNVLALKSRRNESTGEVELFAAGAFTGAGTATSGLSRVARWAPGEGGAGEGGGSWIAMGAGFDAPVRALTFDAGGSLVAGGDFMNSGGAPRTRVARWAGAAWVQMGAAGLPRPVHALNLLSDGRLIAGLHLQQPFDQGPVVNVFIFNAVSGTWAGTGADPATRNLYGTVRAFAEVPGAPSGGPLLVAGNLYDGGFEYGGGTALVGGAFGTWSRVGPWEWADSFTTSIGAVLPSDDGPTPYVLVGQRFVRATVPSTFSLSSWTGGTGPGGFIELYEHPSDGTANSMTRIPAPDGMGRGPIYIGGRFNIPPNPPPAPPFPLGTVFLAKFIDGCCPADIGSAGGLPGSDGLLNNNDFIAFIEAFFARSPVANVGRSGGYPGPDHLWDNNDFIAYIDLFFAGCF